LFVTLSSSIRFPFPHFPVVLLANMASPYAANTSGNEPLTPPIEEETEQRHRLGKSSLDIGGFSANSSTDTLDRLLKNESQETIKVASRGNDLFNFPRNKNKTSKY
jgi:hypothetical protein